MVSEEGVVPTLVVASTAAPFQVRSFSQDCPQPSPYPAIQRSECRTVAMLEVSEPSACDPIDFPDGLVQAFPVRTVCHPAYPALYLGHALTPGPPVHLAFPRVLKVIPEKVEPRPRLVHVHDSGFLGVQADPLLFYPGLQLAVGSLGFLLGSAQNDQIIRVPHQGISLALHQVIQRG